MPRDVPLVPLLTWLAFCLVQAVLAQLTGGEDQQAVALLKPFKMAHVSPRVFWNMVHLLPPAFLR